VSAHRLHITGPADVWHLELRVGARKLVLPPAPDRPKEVLIAELQQIQEAPSVAALIVERDAQL
jgi:hypothetical protein